MAAMTKMSKLKQAGRETMSYGSFHARLEVLDHQLRHSSCTDSLEHDRYIQTEVSVLVDRMQDAVIVRHASRYAPIPVYEGTVSMLCMTPHIEIEWRIKIPQKPESIARWSGIHGHKVKQIKLFEVPGASSWTPVLMTGKFAEMLLWSTMLNNALERINSPMNPLQ